MLAKAQAFITVLVVALSVLVASGSTEASWDRRGAITCKV